MYLAIDIGGTKTLLAFFDDEGTIADQNKFPTNHTYEAYIHELGEQVHKFVSGKAVDGVCVAIPGRLDHSTGAAIAFGNLSWTNIPIKADIEQAIGYPIDIENDVKLAALSEARTENFKGYKKALYLTVSTGISDGLVVDGKIDPNHNTSEAGQMILEHEGRLQKWEGFASGSAIVRRFGKRASDIDDPEIWKLISHDIAVGLIGVIADNQPDVVIIGGGVGSHFVKFGESLAAELHKYATPLVLVPPIMQAVHPEEAVIYGCLEYMKDKAEGKLDEPPAKGGSVTIAPAGASLPPAATPSAPTSPTFAESIQEPATDTTPEPAEPTTAPEIPAAPAPAIPAAS